MPPAPVTCPKCLTALRPAKPVGPGAVIQCPKCATRFRTGGAAGKQGEPAPVAGSADDFASFTREEATAAPERRSACGTIVVGCLLLLAPLLGAGAVLGYCAVVYWYPGILSAIQGSPRDKDKPGEPAKPKDQGSDKP
jgi:hypothetical protein